MKNNNRRVRAGGRERDIQRRHVRGQMGSEGRDSNGAYICLANIWTEKMMFSVTLSDRKIPFRNSDHFPPLFFQKKSATSDVPFASSNPPLLQYFKRICKLESLKADTATVDSSHPVLDLKC